MKEIVTIKKCEDLHRPIGSRLIFVNEKLAKEIGPKYLLVTKQSFRKEDDDWSFVEIYMWSGHRVDDFRNGVFSQDISFSYIDTDWKVLKRITEEELIMRLNIEFPDIPIIQFDARTASYFIFNKERTKNA